MLDGGGLEMTNVLGGKFASAVVRGTCFNVTARMGTVSGESGVAGTWIVSPLCIVSHVILVPACIPFACDFNPWMDT